MKYNCQNFVLLGGVVLLSHRESLDLCYIVISSEAAMQGVFSASIWEAANPHSGGMF